MSIKAYSSYTVVDVVDGLQWQGSFVSAPENPKLGWAYYNIIDKTSYMYDGTNWVAFAYDGEKGNGISKTETQYCQSSSNKTQPTSGWSNSFPAYNTEKPYVWTRIKETWTDTDDDGALITEYHSYKVMSQLDCITEWAAKDGKDLGQWCYDNECSVMEGGAIASGTITADQIAANAITSDHIEAQSITAEHIESEAITSGHITANAITVDKIAANAITAEKIQASAITADKINVDSLSAISADMGYIRAGVIESENYNDMRICNMTGDFGIRYSLSNGEYTVIGYNGSSKQITIPYSYMGYPVTSIAQQAFENNEKITSITLPESIVTIGGYAFHNCRNLRRINIPNSVTSIGNWAFFGCSQLEAIVIPSSITSIGDYAFYGCEQLQKVTIRSGLTSIPQYAFSDCSNLYKITIPDSVTSIGRQAFNACSSLTSIIIPSSVTSMGFYAFEGCHNLTIYCEAESKPSGWNSYWNDSNCPVYWYSEDIVNTDENYWRHAEDVNGFKISCEDNYIIKSTGFTLSHDGEMIALKGRIGDSVIDENGRFRVNSLYTTTDSGSGTIDISSQTNGIKLSNYSQYSDKDPSYSITIRPQYGIELRNQTIQASGAVSNRIISKIHVNNVLGLTLESTIGYLMGTWWLNNSTLTTSDANAKHDIELQPEIYSQVFDKLQPSIFKYNDGSSDRYHTGLIAQDVEDAVLSTGLTTKDFAAVCYNIDDDGNKTHYGIRYEELVSMCIYEIQKLKKQVESLKAELKTPQND